MYNKKQLFYYYSAFSRTSFVRAHKMWLRFGASRCRKKKQRHTANPGGNYFRFMPTLRVHYYLFQTIAFFQCFYYMLLHELMCGGCVYFSGKGIEFQKFMQKIELENSTNCIIVCAVHRHCLYTKMFSINKTIWIVDVVIAFGPNRRRTK